MDDARRKVLDRIRKRVKRIKEIRTNTTKGMTYEEIVFTFFRDIEELYSKPKDAHEWQFLLSSKGMIFDSRMRMLDGNIQLELIWNETQKWDELRLQGVSIKWSSDHMAKNPEQVTPIYIDVAQMLLS